MNPLDKLKGAIKSKTMLFSFLLVVFGAIEANETMLQASIPPKFYGPFVMVVGVICAALRWVTTQPLEQK